MKQTPPAISAAGTASKAGVRRCSSPNTWLCLKTKQNPQFWTSLTNTTYKLLQVSSIFPCKTAMTCISSLSYLGHQAESYMACAGDTKCFGQHPCVIRTWRQGANSWSFKWAIVIVEKSPFSQNWNWLEVDPILDKATWHNFLVMCCTRWVTLVDTVIPLNRLGSKF